MAYNIDSGRTVGTELPNHVEQTAVSSNTVYNPLPNQSPENNLPPYITFLSPCKLLICRVHGICLTRKDLSDHLKQEHDMSKEQTKQALKVACELNVASSRIRIKPPSPEAPPIQGLEVQLGYMCAKMGCQFLSPQPPSLWSHLSKHGIHREDEAHGALYHNVAIQNLFPGKRPLYFVVNPSAAPGKVEWDSIAGKTVAGDETYTESSEAANRIPGLSDDEFAGGQDYPRAPTEKEELSGAAKKPQLSTLPTDSLPVAKSDPVSSSQLISDTVSPSQFSHTILQTKRQDTGGIHICLASDILMPGSNITTLDPSRLDFESYYNLLKNEGILDREGNLDLVFHPAGGERIIILNQMMFCAAVTYQVDRKVDMVTFSAVARQGGWFRFW